MKLSLFRNLLIVWLPLIFIMRIAGFGRIVGIPANYYIWILFYLYILFSHIKNRKGIFFQDFFYLTIIVIIYTLIHFLLSPYPLSMLIKRFGIFVFYMIMPFFISHNIGMYKCSKYLSVYMDFLFHISVLFIVMFLINISPDGFYLSGSNRNAIVFLLTPGFVYYFRNRKTSGILKVVVLAVANILSFSRAAFLMIMFVFMYELIYPSYDSEIKESNRIYNSIYFLYRKLRISVIIFAVLVYSIVIISAKYIPVLEIKIKKMDVIFSGKLIEGKISKDEGDYRRSVLMKESIGLFKRHKLFGIGFGATLDYLRNRLKVGKHYRAMPHNLYILLLAENGVVGAILILFLYYLHYRHTIVLPELKHISRLTFLSLFLISVGNEYLVTSPWFSIWLGLTSVYSYQFRRVKIEDIRSAYLTGIENRKLK